MTDIELVLVQLLGWNEVFPVSRKSMADPNGCSFHGRVVYEGPAYHTSIGHYDINYSSFPCTLAKGHTGSHVLHNRWSRSLLVHEVNVVGELA